MPGDSDEQKDLLCCHINLKTYDKCLNIIGIFFCEMLGTCTFVFLGCLGCIEGIGIENSITFNALSFGVAALVATQICFRGSGGHLNPCVTIASLFFRHMKYYMGVLYCVAQVIGALLGFGLVKWLIPNEYMRTGSYEKYGLCTTVPNPKFPIFTILAMEFLMTSTLVLVICSMWDIRNRETDHANLKYCLTMFFLINVGGTFTGCSMNPVRSFAPAFWNNSWKMHWVYWLVPIFSGMFGGFFYTVFYGPECYKRKSSVSRITVH